MTMERRGPEKKRERDTPKGLGMGPALPCVLYCIVPTLNPCGLTAEQVGIKPNNYKCRRASLPARIPSFAALLSRCHACLTFSGKVVWAIVIQLDADAPGRGQGQARGYLLRSQTAVGCSKI